MNHPVTPELQAATWAAVILAPVPYRANTSTHRMFTVGTMAALATAARAMPWAPNKPATIDTPT